MPVEASRPISSPMVKHLLLFMSALLHG